VKGKGGNFFKKKNSFLRKKILGRGRKREGKNFNRRKFNVTFFR